ncbi:unnamed protein product, partial [Meganyctiphanes norvegica]
GMSSRSYQPVGGPRRQLQPSPRPQGPPPSLGQQPMPLPMPSGPDPVLSRRLDMLEQRLNSTEQSNRTLLDEIIRVQQDNKISVKKNEIGLGEERENRSRLDTAFRQTQNKIYEFDDRIRRSEEG